MDRHLTKVDNQKIRKASPECSHPIRGSESQTSYPRMHKARQAIPRFNGKTPWKRGLQNPSKGKEEEREQREKLSQEVIGNIGSKDSNKSILNSHATGS